MTTIAPAPPPLVGSADLVQYKGAPFAEDLVAAACSQVRGEAGWHIAPETARKVMVSGTGGPRLVLPSLRIAQVLAVHTVTAAGAADVALTGWRPVGAGMLLLPAGWPRGDHNLVVSMVDGLVDVPAELVAVVAERARALASPLEPGVTSSQKVVGGVSTYRQFAQNPVAWSLAAASVIDRYRVGS